MATTDPADEAGGEVVYSSDGLAPVPVTKPPSLPDLTVDEETILDSSSVSPQTAFEVFQGKVYTAKLLAKAPVVGKESPLEKLARLQEEANELEAQLVTTKAGEGRDFDEQLLNFVFNLKTRLTKISTLRVMEHDELTRLIRDQVKTLEKPSMKAAGGGTTPSSGVVYELYGSNNENNATGPTTTMEDRLLKLEKLLGSSQVDGGGSAGSVATTAHKSLVHRLEDLELLVKTVDAATLEQTATKAKVIRADLEAASKARNKLTATYKKEDSKMIQQLHQQMVELEGLSGFLPALTSRLQQLAGLHVQASTFSTRLQELETLAKQVESTVAQLEGTQKQLQSNMVENVQTMEKNMKQLDVRLKKLK